MTLQWKDELESKFGLTFDIIDRDRISELRRLRGFSVNPSSEADTVCACIRDEIGVCLDEWSAKNPDVAPRILIDEAERSPYKELTEDTNGSLNQINIRTEGDHLIDLSRRSNVVAALKTYKAFRVYHADDDDEAKRKITEIMNAGMSKWPA
jgi:uncharacterized protein